MQIVSGEVKTERLRTCFENEEVNWKGSTAYADSMSDVDILLMVGKPVVVNPEKELRKLAVHKEWRIIEVPLEKKKKR